MEEISLEPDLIDPAEEDWATVSETALYVSAQAGIALAIAEVARREAGSKP
jgi:hypothetical protein